MKTRSEMIYDFMLALSANPNILPDPREHQMIPEEASEVYGVVYELAAVLADKYLESL